MNIDQIKEMMDLLEASGLQKLVFKDIKGCEIHLEKPSLPPVYGASITQPTQSVSHVVKDGKEESFTGHYITSPMVGTFYLQSGPSEKPFVKIGDQVSKNSIVCIVEAMKVMNEIKACLDGKIVEICLPDGHPVEFGTKIFRVEP